MKKILIISLSASVLVSPAFAGKKFGKKPKARAAKVALVGDAAEFGVLADKFREHQILTSRGGLYYSKSDTGLRSSHSHTYQMIQKACTEDRLDEEIARDSIDKLLTIGAAYQAAGENADKAETKSKIEALQKSVKGAVAEKAPAGVITPKVNKLQFHTEESLRFGEASGRLSKGDVSSIRRHLDSLERKEDSYKSSGTLSDSNHEKLLEDAREIWRDSLERFS